MNSTPRPDVRSVRSPDAQPSLRPTSAVDGGPPPRPLPGSDRWRHDFITTLEAACADVLASARLPIDDAVDRIFADPDCFHGVLVGVLGDVLHLRRGTTLWLALASEIAAACAFNALRRQPLPSLPWLSVAVPSTSPPGLPVQQLGQLAATVAQRGAQVLGVPVDVARLFGEALGPTGAPAGVERWLEAIGEPVQTPMLVACTRQAAAVARAGAGAVALVLALRSEPGPAPETILEFAHAIGSVHALGALYEMRRLRLVAALHDEPSLALRELVGIQQMRIELGRQSSGLYRALLAMRIDQQGAQALERLGERTIARLERSFRIDSQFIIGDRQLGVAADWLEDAPLPPRQAEWQAAAARPRH